MTAPLANRSLFAILSALIEERAGLHHGELEQQLFLDKVSSRASEAGFESLLDYYYYLRYDASADDELNHLVDSLVVNETFFFRELAPLRLLVTHFLAPRIAQGQHPRVWSAACATGEEPLTLAMLLADAGLLSSVELIASDISGRALERARAGRFSARSLRHVPEPELAKRWLVEDGGRFTVAAALREAISWKRLNLCTDELLGAVGPCDFILCRNALIYFSDETAVRVVERLTATLKPQGALFVGVSESLLRFGTSLVCEETGRVFYYRKAT